jgi:hypothetical protein
VEEWAKSPWDQLWAELLRKGPTILADGPCSPLPPKLVKLWSFACCYLVVCAASASTTRILSSASAYSQQASILRQHNVERPNPPPQFIQDLQTFLTKHVLSNDHVIIVGDFKESLAGGGRPPFRSPTRFDLCDVMDACVGHSSFNTYARGSSRIDFILCSPDVLPAIRNGGYGSFGGHCVKGDHRPVYLDLDTEQLDNISVIPLVCPSFPDPFHITRVTYGATS